MSAKLAALAIALATGATGVAAATPNDATIKGRALVEACKGREGWSDAAPPARIFGNTYYVGTCGITVLLVASPKGHILIDGATAEAAPSILANIRTLGFDPKDVRLIIGSHEHLDHMGGFAALKAATGARLLVRQPARRAVETGKTDAADPQAGAIPDMAPVTVDGVVGDGQVLRFGPIAITARATPGHTSGGTSWTWRSCEGKACVAFAYVDSMSAISARGYRFTDHPERVASYRTTFTRVAGLDCDVLVTPHPVVSNLFDRLGGKAPLRDRTACTRLVERSRTALEARLATEAATVR
ncbi:subclass B3 metallo-beta-lactamase [Sphingomonas sp. SUN039]|uniref:subclass B3 metallo-beta-lactamase n=1 Tax=Sphingomonas sp. SUN039 TaxID=2937787 RepID=UPI0021643C47|nr:subclass B3 metallo-beta-lactamase [Sphingomonas sp. SUN039]UVO54328.1 subclass B3 metallo-beta-lactamase [Sphingomonas sp. SUN039]